eukprot:Nk52_evm13s152 gene=Nk52_evmTU13s152
MVGLRERKKAKLSPLFMSLSVIVLGSGLLLLYTSSSYISEYTSTIISQVDVSKMWSDNSVNTNDQALTGTEVVAIPGDRVASATIGNYMKHQDFETKVVSRYLCTGETIQNQLDDENIDENDLELFEDFPTFLTKGDRPPTKEYVVLSLTKDLSAVDYGFQAPISASLWKNHIGVEVIVFIITSIEGGEKEWTEHPKRSLIVKELGRVGAHVLFIPTEDNHTLLLGQNIRMYASLLPFVNDWDILTPSDVDIFPLRPAAFRFTPLFYCETKRGDGSRFLKRNSVGVVVYNAYCCGSFDLTVKGKKEHVSQMYPICHISMPSSEWKEIYIGEGVKFFNGQQTSQNSSFERDLGNAALHNLKSFYSQKQIDTRYKKPKGLFFADQHSVSLAIERSHWFPNSTLRIPRSTGRDRIDRGNWLAASDTICDVVRTKNDIHNYQNTALDDKEWNNNLLILDCLLQQGTGFNNEELKLLQKYRTGFKKVAMQIRASKKSA